LEYVETNLKEPIELRDLAGVARLSLFHFARAFKNAEGVTPHAYIVRRRVERAKELLLDDKLSIAEIALETGFSDQSHLARQFRAAVGQTPGMFRGLGQ
jgi:AraC family transcriptional regulator